MAVQRRRNQVRLRGRQGRRTGLYRLAVAVVAMQSSIIFYLPSHFVSMPILFKKASGFGVLPRNFSKTSVSSLLPPYCKSSCRNLAQAFLFRGSAAKLLSKSSSPNTFELTSHGISKIEILCLLLILTRCRRSSLPHSRRQDG